jgi:signal transduction histidine kinase
MAACGGSFCGNAPALSEPYSYRPLHLLHDHRERRHMLADIAHELRIPLTILRGRLEGILDGIYLTASGALKSPAGALRVGRAWGWPLPNNWWSFTTA